MKYSDRQRLIHNYDGTNWSIIVEVLFDDMPVFVKQLEELLFPEQSPE